MSGGMVSSMMTLKLVVAKFPLPSVAVQVTGVVPLAKVDPDAGVQLTSGAALELSVAAGVAKVTTAPLTPVAGSVMSASTLANTGSTESAIDTVRIAVVELMPSLAV